MLTVLRSLALLDRSFSQVCKQYNTYSKPLNVDGTFTRQQVRINQKSDTSVERPKTTIMMLKRKVGYGDMIEINEEEGARGEKRNKMDVDTMTSMPSGP